MTNVAVDVKVDDIIKDMAEDDVQVVKEVEGRRHRPGKDGQRVARSSAS